MPTIGKKTGFGFAVEVAAVVVVDVVSGSAVVWILVLGVIEARLVADLPRDLWTRRLGLAVLGVDGSHSTTGIFPGVDGDSDEGRPVVGTVLATLSRRAYAVNGMLGGHRRG